MKISKLKNNHSSAVKLSAGAVASVLLASAAIFSGTQFSSAAAQAPRLMAPPLAADGTLSFADLVERVSPAVVSIVVEREVQARRLPSELEDFFNFRRGAPRPDGDSFGDEPQLAQGEGSGFFIDADGHIVTNNHVVADAAAVRIRFSDGEELEAEIVGVDELTDLAVLKVEPKDGQPFVEFADSVNLRVGDWVVAVGNPFGLGGTVTSGIVSAIGGQNRENQYLDFIQIDAPINRGNSGGPTFDLKGRVVGVNTAIFSPNGGSVGIGFAIPAKVAKQTVAQLIDNGSVTRGWLGIGLQDVTTELAVAMDLKEAKGVIVREVIDGTPAADAGLESGDVILRVDGEQIESSTELSRHVASLPPGQKVDVRVSRDGKIKNIDVTLGQRDADEGAIDDDEPANDNDTLSSEIGLRVSDLSPALRQQFRIPEEVDGVVVTGVRPGSPAQDAGLRPGVVILQMDGDDVESTRDLNRKIDNAKESGKDAVLLRMQIAGNRQFGALSLDSE